MANQTGDKSSTSFDRRVVVQANPENFAIAPSRTALIIVDMQNDFLHPDGWFPASGLDPSPLRVIIPVINRLTTAARACGIHLIWLNWGIQPGAPEVPQALKLKGSLGGKRPTYGEPSATGRGHILVQGEWGAATIEELYQGPDDHVVYKHRLTGFFDNELESILRNLDVGALLFAGVNTDRCVYATLSDAAYRGYRCLVIEDACATGSPDDVRNSILFLVRLLHGATTNSHSLMSALESIEREN